MPVESARLGVKFYGPNTQFRKCGDGVIVAHKYPTGWPNAGRGVGPHMYGTVNIYIHTFHIKEL